MKHLISTFSLACALSAGTALAAHSEDRLCHIANAGFYVDGGEKGFFVDAVIERDNYEGRFALPSQETFSSMISHGDIFQGATVALVTHMHGDHFDAMATLRHLRATNVTYFMPPEAFELLKATGLTDSDAKRVNIVLPDWEGGPVRTSVGGMTVEAFRVDHGPNMPQNIGYRVTMNGRTYFHTGDINASSERLLDAGLKGITVDYMLMPFWFAQNREVVDASWQIGTLVGMHYHAQEAPWMAQYGGPEGLRTGVAELWPNSLRIDKEMQCETVQ